MKEVECYKCQDTGVVREPVLLRIESCECSKEPCMDCEVTTGLNQLGACFGCGKPFRESSGSK